MPLYSYSCSFCDHHFENFLTIENRNNSVKCPSCRAERAKRVITPVHWKFSEGGGPISSKNDSYWSNAEENRLKNKKKKEKEEQERFYYDEIYRSKKTEGEIRRSSRNTSEVEFKLRNE